MDIGRGRGRPTHHREKVAPGLEGSEPSRVSCPILPSLTPMILEGREQRWGLSRKEEPRGCDPHIRLQTTPVSGEDKFPPDLPGPSKLSRRPAHSTHRTSPSHFAYTSHAPHTSKLLGHCPPYLPKKSPSGLGPGRLGSLAFTEAPQSFFSTLQSQCPKDHRRETEAQNLCPKPLPISRLAQGSPSKLRDAPVDLPLQIQANCPPSWTPRPCDGAWPGPAQIGPARSLSLQHPHRTAHHLSRVSPS